MICTFTVKQDNSRTGCAVPATKPTQALKNGKMHTLSNGHTVAAIHKEALPQWEFPLISLTHMSLHMIVNLHFGRAEACP